MGNWDLTTDREISELHQRKYFLKKFRKRTGDLETKIEIFQCGNILFKDEIEVRFQKYTVGRGT